jgi:lysine 2,3-aminomutase
MKNLTCNPGAERLAELTPEAPDGLDPVRGSRPPTAATLAGGPHAAAVRQVPPPGEEPYAMDNQAAAVVSPDVPLAARQPYEYSQRRAPEPDWRRLPGYRRVTPREWRDPRWQRANSVTTVAQLREVFGTHLPQSLADSIAEDQRRQATMRLRVTPHVLNTMEERQLWADPVRRYLLPAAADREPVWHTHPAAQRDSLHEAEMSAVEGLVWRYPTKALVEVADTCPVYCGHCTRMDLVGPDVPAVVKTKLRIRLQERLDGVVAYLRSAPTIRDLVISGGDVANMRPELLEEFVTQILEVGHVRQIRLATKAVIALPQYFLDDRVLKVMERIARKTRAANVDVSIHTHANHAQSVTPLVSEAAARLFDAGYRNIRNQGVLMRTVNDSAASVLDLCFRLLDEAQITPYYFYLCDLIPFSEHWRLSLEQAQKIQEEIMGYLPGFATPRFVCDVPYVGKRWVHQAEEYDRVRGISYWRKNYWTPVDTVNGDPMRHRFAYYDPVGELPEEGQRYWAAQVRDGAPAAL